MSDGPSDREQSIEPSPGSGERRRWIRRTVQSLRAADSREEVVEAAARLRRLLPGDSRYGDPLSVAGREPPALVGRTVSALGTDRPSAAREIGMGALQVWQALSEAQGRGRGEEEVALLFTDLVGFSAWALQAGDAAAVELLRRVGVEVEGAVADHDGKIVKRLGDGIMAVFGDPADAVRAALDAQERLTAVEVEGHRPRMRAGVHCGKPRRIGGDYLGTDVNIAARVADAAAANEVLVSDCVAGRIDGEALEVARGRRLRAQGAPRDTRVHAVRPRGRSGADGS